MKTKAAIKYFKSRRVLAQRLGIKTPSIHDWGEIVPMARQLQIQELTGGALRAMHWRKYFARRQGQG